MASTTCCSSREAEFISQHVGLLTNSSSRPLTLFCLPENLYICAHAHVKTHTCTCPPEGPCAHS